MTEPMRVACVLFGGEDRRILVRGKVELFEDHPYCGPMPVRKDGRERHLGPRHPFWQAVTDWYRCGKPVDDEGFCLYAPEPKDILRHIGGRQWKVVGQEPALQPSRCGGSPGGATRE
jgi:hypothetical protein